MLDDNLTSKLVETKNKVFDWIRLLVLLLYKMSGDVKAFKVGLRLKVFEKFNLPGYDNR